MIRSLDFVCTWSSYSCECVQWCCDICALVLKVVVTILYAPSAASDITEGPVSVTALVGTNAQFHCAGTGNYLVWVVDGLQADHSSISSRGVTSDITTDSGSVHSTLAHCTRNNSKQWYYCTMCTVQYTSSDHEQPLYIDNTARWIVLVKNNLFSCNASCEAMYTPKRM